MSEIPEFRDSCNLNSIDGLCRVKEEDGSLCRLNVNGNCNKMPSEKNRIGKGNIGIKKAWERKLAKMKKEA